MSAYPWLWDVEMDGADYDRLLAGDRGNMSPSFSPDWALLRLIEYAPYRELMRRLPRERFMAQWPGLAAKVRSSDRREGMNYVFDWLQRREGGRHA